MLLQEVFLSLRGFLSEVFCLKGFAWGGFIRSPSVRIHPLQQKVKYHSQFQVSYV